MDLNILTNGQFASRIINDLGALTKDQHISRRWILNIGRIKAESYVAQHWDSGNLYGDKRLLTRLHCVEMIEVDKISCCNEEFKLCGTLMRSKYKLPGLLYGMMRPAITGVTNVDNSIFFRYGEIKNYRLQSKRRYANKVIENRPFYYVEDDYIYIPDFHIELINVEYFTVRKKKALELFSCDFKEDKCRSEWDYEFFCPVKLIEPVIRETLEEASLTLKIVKDENPNMDLNQKTATVQ